MKNILKKDGSLLISYKAPLEINTFFKTFDEINKKYMNKEVKIDTFRVDTFFEKMIEDDWEI